jgi:hypothetical protein
MSIDFALDPCHILVLSRIGEVLAHGIYTLSFLRGVSGHVSKARFTLVEARGGPHSPALFEAVVDTSTNQVLAVTLTQEDDFTFEQSPPDFFSTVL